MLAVFDSGKKSGKGRVEPAFPRDSSWHTKEMVGLGVWLRFVLAVLATWRVTHLLSSEDGPGDLIVRLRARLGQGLAGQLMDCFNCLSLWVAAPAAFFVSRKLLGWTFSWLALSGAACLLERLGHEPVMIQRVSQEREGEVNDVLRSETISAAERSNAGDNVGYRAKGG